MTHKKLLFASDLHIIWHAVHSCVQMSPSLQFSLQNPCRAVFYRERAAGIYNVGPYVAAEALVSSSLSGHG